MSLTLRNIEGKVAFNEIELHIYLPDFNDLINMKVGPINSH